MPIYAYRCEACGHTKDVLQKISDPLLTVCPSCGAPALKKQVTAAGFQLKGSGWYVTDFRGGQGAAKGDANAESGKEESKGEAAKSDAPKSDAAKTVAAKADTPAASPAPAAPSPPATPSASGGA